MGYVGLLVSRFHGTVVGSGEYHSNSDEWISKRAASNDADMRYKFAPRHYNLGKSRMQEQVAQLLPFDGRRIK